MAVDSSQHEWSCPELIGFRPRISTGTRGKFLSRLLYVVIIIANLGRFNDNQGTFVASFEETGSLSLDCLGWW